jgi:hypothetical protein
LTQTTTAAAPAAAASLPPGDWAAALEPGERLLWEGAPATGARLRRRDALMVPLSLAWAGFAVFFEVKAALTGAPWLLLMIGGAVVAGAVYFVGGRFLLDSWRRGRTRYALTDRRAMVAVGGPRGQARSMAIDASTKVEYRPGEEAMIILAPPPPADPEAKKPAPLAFEFIAGGERVRDLIRAVQEGRAP